MKTPSESIGKRRERWGERIFVHLLAACALAGTLPFPAGAASDPGEYDVKAALLFNFAKFVEWPAGSFAAVDDPFVIGVVGSDPFGHSLERTLAGQTIGGRRIQIRRWKKARELGACQVLFVAASEQEDVRGLLDGMKGRPVLSVSDMSDFASDGGIIGLVMDHHRVRFEINQNRADRAGLKLSSRLLSLAHLVQARN